MVVGAEAEDVLFHIGPVVRQAQWVVNVGSFGLHSTAWEHKTQYAHLTRVLVWRFDRVRHHGVPHDSHPCRGYARRRLTFADDGMTKRPAASPQKSTVISF
jgi:hypothetical protein